MLWTWFAFSALTLLVWSLRHLAINRAMRLLPPLRADMYPERHDQILPSVSFLVAGKDEESNIEACLRSLIAQDYPRLRIIAANDRSTDATGQIMDRLRDGTDRLTTVHVRELRPGWFGKNNAMREAVDRADGEWLCFTDADCIMTSPRALRVAMGFAMEKQADFISVLPAHDAHGFWEKVVQPACSGILLISFNPMKVNNPRSRAAYANGAFMLMRRSCYERIGGHDAVKRRLNEDIHMARLAKERGQKLAVVSNDDLYTVRMYESFSAIWSGWSRIYFGCFGTMRRLTGSLLLVLFFTMLPWIAAAIWLSSQGSGPALGPPWNLLGPTALAAGLIQLSVTMRFYALGRIHPLYGLLYPLGALIGCGALINAMRRVGGRGRITWRGTTYQGDAVAPAPAAKALNPSLSSPEPAHPASR